MKACRVIRRVAALALLVALFLPLSRCSDSTAAAKPVLPAETAGAALTAETAETAQAGQPPAQPATYKYFYAWTDFKVDSAGSWLIFLVFLWPLPFLAHEWTRRGKPVPLWVLAAQLPLAAGAVTLLYYRTFLEELWVGGYLAYAALGSLAAALLAEIALRAAHWARTSPGHADRK
jgi:hypothetical protein